MAEPDSSLFASVMDIISSDAFLGGLWLALFGAISGAAILLLRTAIDLFSRYFVVRATVSNTEEAFDWLVLWLASQKNLFSSQKLKLEMKRDAESSKPGEKAKVRLLPGAGFHLFPFKGKMIWMHRSSGKRLTTGWEQTPFQFESLSLSTYSRGRKIFEDLFETVQKYAESLNNDKTKIYTLGGGTYRWTCAMAKPPRPLDSVILDTNVAETILADCTDFFNRRSWYEDRGIPYRRGYLLYGPAGTGKTSFTQSLAGKLNIPICVLTLSSSGLSDASLNARLHETPDRSIILLEDVDAIFVQRESMNKRSRSVTFSGLLNALDGVASQENRLLFMTTNHIEKLDPALIRPGRCDVHIKFDFASPSQMRRLFLKFFPDEPDAADVFSQQLAGADLSMAALQGYLMKRRDDVAVALRETRQLRAAEAERISTAKSMEIGAWLTRLGLEQYYDNFADAKVYRVADMPSNLEALGVNILGHRKRIKAMLDGRADVVSQFAFATAAQAEATFMQCFTRDGAGPDVARQFADSIPEHTVSIAQIMKHCAQFRSNPAKAASAPEIAKLIAKSQRTFGRGAEVNVAMALLSTGEEEVYDDMELEAWLRRLNLTTYIAAARRQGLTTVRDLRRARQHLGELGINDEPTKELVNNMLDGKSVATDKFKLVESAQAAGEVFQTSFPEATKVFAKTVPRDRSVAELEAFCSHHRTYDELGCEVADPSGVRAAAMAESLSDSGPAPSDVRLLGTLLRRLGLQHLLPCFRKQNCVLVADLKAGTEYFPASDMKDMFEIPQLGDCVRLASCLNLEPAGLAMWAQARTQAQVTAAFKHVFPASSDTVVQRFTKSVPLQQVSVGQIISFCAKHCEQVDASEGKGDDKSDAGDRDSTGEAALEHVAELLRGKSTSSESKGSDSPDDSETAVEDVDIGPWLEGLGLSAYASALRDEGFDDATLLKDVTDEELKSIGISKMGARSRLVTAAAKL